MSGQSFSFRIFMSLLLMIGYYVLAVFVATFLLFLIYMQFLYSEWINIYFLAVCFGGVGIILWSIIPRGTKFIKSGPLLKRSEYPKLFEFIDSIALTAGQKTPDEVYLSFEINAWVGQRSGFLGIGSKRIMGIGLPLIQLLTVSQLKAVLAHEFGHYFAGDTKLAPFAYKTRQVIERTIGSLARHQSPFLNIFLSYGKMFLKITHATSRSQEIAADLFAAKLAGSQSCINALRILYSSDQVLHYFWYKEMEPILRAGYRPDLLRTFKQYTQSEPIAKMMQDNLEKELKYPRLSMYNTHPPISERISAVDQISFEVVEENSSSAIYLLKDIQQTEYRLLEFMLGSNRARELKKVDWKNEEQSYITVWQADMKTFLPSLKGITPENLPIDYMSLVAFTASLANGMNIEIDFEEGKEYANIAIGEALSIMLYYRGWKLNKIPGHKVILYSNGLEIEPFSILDNLHTTRMNKEDWIHLCKEIGIFGLDLMVEVENLVTDDAVFLSDPA